MVDLEEVTRVVDELNKLEQDKNGKSQEEKIKLLDKQASLWCELNALVDDVVCKWD